MFERLMDSESGNPALPFSQLSMQKRMHPEISELMKKTLYPYLTDHPSTLLHPSVAGLSHRMYWLDHRVPEDQSVASVGSSKSFSNAYEADMVGGLVRYLVNGNAYGLRDIVVLVSVILLNALYYFMRLIFADTIQWPACRVSGKATFYLQALDQ